MDLYSKKFFSDIKNKTKIRNAFMSVGYLTYTYSDVKIPISFTFQCKETSVPDLQQLIKTLQLKFVSYQVSP